MSPGDIVVWWRHQPPAQPYAGVVVPMPDRDLSDCRVLVQVGGDASLLFDPAWLNVVGRILPGERVPEWTTRRVRELEAQIARWRRAIFIHAEKCATCDGEGTMEVDVDDGHGYIIGELEPCGECAGTGKGDIAEALELARREERARVADPALDLLARESARERAEIAEALGLDPAGPWTHEQLVIAARARIAQVSHLEAELRTAATSLAAIEREGR